MTTLKGSLQGKGIDLTSVPGMVDKRLKDVKVVSKRGTWFKDHCLVFSDPNYPRIQINAMISLTLMIPPPKHLISVLFLY